MSDLIFRLYALVFLFYAFFHFFHLIAELEAYSSVVSALRAQGELTKERRKVLHELSGILNVPIDRHKAEIRRAVNDEQLSTIAAR